MTKTSLPPSSLSPDTVRVIHKLRQAADLAALEGWTGVLILGLDDQGGGSSCASLTAELTDNLLAIPAERFRALCIPPQAIREQETEQDEGTGYRGADVN